MQLNRKLYNETISNAPLKNMPEKVLQFGEGNFLRAFVDEMLDQLNENDLFGGSIVLVQPIKEGLVNLVNEQDGLYTLLLRGLEKGETVCKKKIITSVSRGINPYSDFDDYFACARNEELRFIVSNTTEAGIVYNENDKLTDKPQVSFPAKVTAFLYERFKHFNGAKEKGLVFIPCELIDNNGTMLKKYVLQYSKSWELESEFITWINEACIFTNTLVDRIVTGYPRDEIAALTEEFGYEDKLINTGEIFHFWVIEGPKELENELPFHKIGLNVLFTDDATPYKLRKVRILNGAHTMSVLAAYLSGKDTVGEMMADETFNKFLQKALFEEIIPTLDLDENDLISFANAVFDRFANPYIKHLLLSISLNSTSKYKTRVLPSILEYYNRKKAMPKMLTFSLAALFAFYRGSRFEGNVLLGERSGQNYNIADDVDVLELFQKLWSECDMTKEGINTLVHTLCSSQRLWGTDLSDLENFEETISEHLYNILQNGMYTEVKKLLC